MKMPVQPYKTFCDPFKHCMFFMMRFAQTKSSKESRDVLLFQENPIDLHCLQFCFLVTKCSFYPISSFKYSLTTLLCITCQFQVGPHSPSELPYLCGVHIYNKMLETFYRDLKKHASGYFYRDFNNLLFSNFGQSVFSVLS